RGRGRQPDPARVRSFAILLVLLAGCATVKDETTMPVHVVWQNVDDVQATCEEISGRREVFRILGCSKWREVAGQRTCTIYAQAPRDERDLQRFATQVALVARRLGV